MPDGHGIWHFDEEVNIPNTYLPFPFLNIYMCVCVHIYLYIYLYVYIFIFIIYPPATTSVCVCHCCCLCRGGCVDSGVAVVTLVRYCGSRGASCSCPCFTYCRHVRFDFFIYLLFFGKVVVILCVLYPDCVSVFLSLSTVHYALYINKCLFGIYLSIINVHKQHITHARVHGQNIGFFCYLTQSS